ncbi:hypothetical protein CRYUN_Cryun04dG0091500 [Craigia yunnanensis]
MRQDGVVLSLPVCSDFPAKRTQALARIMEGEKTNTTTSSISKQVAEMEEETKSPTNSQQTISDNDEIDYSTKPEFYDPDLDDKDELWVQNKRKGHISDAVLSCPACFTTLCLECQRCRFFALFLGE